MALALGWHAALDRRDVAAVAPIAGGTVAAVAFLFNAWFTDRQNRIKSTLDLYFARFANATYNGYANDFYVFRTDIASAESMAALQGVGPPGTDGKAADPEAVIKAVVYILNYWETLATAYIEDHLDRATFDNLSCELVVMVVERTASIIGTYRRSDPEYFANLVSLFWHSASPAQRRDLTPKLGPAPSRLPPWDKHEWTRLAAQV